MKFNNFFRFMAGMILAALAAFSCQKSSVTKTNTLKVVPSSTLNFKASGNDAVLLSVETNASEWTFTAPEWVEAVKEANSLSVNVKDNESKNSRVGRISFTAGNAKPVRVSIVQDGKENGVVTGGVPARLVGADGTNNIKVSFSKSQKSYKAVVKIVLDEPAASDVAVQLSLDPDYLAAYKYENKVDCELVPTSKVTLPNDGIVEIAAGSQESEPIEILVDVTEFVNLKEYLLPLVASNADGVSFSVSGKRANWLLKKRLDKQVKNIVFLEVNNTNPLNLLEYKLEDGSSFFDVAVIFAANIVYDQEMNSLNLHFNPNVQALLDENEKYLQPLRDAGIEVQLGLMPHHTQAGLENLSDKGIELFAGQVADALETYNLDGFNMDDEYLKDPVVQSDLFIDSHTNGLKLSYAIKQKTEAKGRKCSVSIFNFKWESRSSFEYEGKTIKTGEVVDALIENYFVDGYVGKAKPWDESMNLKQCTGYSIECNKGHIKDLGSKWNTNITVENAAKVVSDGYGYIMWFAFHPQNGGGLDNNAKTVEPAIRNVAKGLYNQNIVTPRKYYKKIDEGVFDAQPYDRDSNF